TVRECRLPARGGCAGGASGAGSEGLKTRNAEVSRAGSGCVSGRDGTAGFRPAVGLTDDSVHRRLFSWDHPGPRVADGSGVGGRMVIHFPRTWKGHFSGAARGAARPLALARTGRDCSKPGRPVGPAV